MKLIKNLLLLICLFVTLAACDSTQVKDIMKVYKEEKYVEEIVCTTEGFESTPDQKDWDGVIKAKKGDVIVIKCAVKPDNADNTDLDFIWKVSDVDAGKYTVTNNGDNTITIKILKACSPVITVRSTDRNPGVSLRIKIDCPKSSSDIFG